MYSLTQLWEGLTHPVRGGLEVYKLWNRNILGRTGTRVMDEDWDTLIVLDACRYDLFESVVSCEELQSVWSVGSHTSEFLQRNFEKAYPDTVYVCATPQFERQGMTGKFFKEEYVWRDGWDENLRTVPPEEVTDAAIKTFQRYPNKRYIVHYLQPHYPFIGETGRKIEHATVTGDGIIYDRKDSPTIWELLEQGHVDRETVWDAYKENLELVLPHVEQCIETLGGKSVITSDHGNCFGEFGIFGHPQRVLVRELVEVPWLITEHGPRREIQAGDQTASTRTETSDVEDRLNALGYK